MSFGASIADGWDILGVANGGYLLALAYRAIADVSAMPDVITLSANYIRPTSVGPARLVVERMGGSKRHETLTAVLLQDDRPRAHITAVVGDLTGGPEEQRLWELAPPDLPPPDKCTRIVPQPGQRLPPPVVGQVDLRLSARGMSLPDADAAGLPEVRGWVRFPDGRPTDTAALALFADVFPPAIYYAGYPPRWVPTLNLALEVRSRPSTAWVSCSFRTHALIGNYVDVDGHIWDGHQKLVARTRQLALVPLKRADRRRVKPTAL